MPAEDAELIIKELRSQSTPKPVIEVLGASKGGAREVVGGISSAGAGGAGAEAQGVSEVVTLLREAAQLFGYYPVSDVDVGGYRLGGLAWWGGNEDEYRDGLAPLAVFEVVDNPEQALARLKHARDRWRGGVRLYAVVRDEGVRRELERVLRGGSFHELRRKVRVIMLDELRGGLVQDLRRHGELVREFVMLDKD